MKKIAFGIGIAPIICFGLIVFWYLIAVPYFNKNEMERFSGTYEIQTIEKGKEKTNSELNLFADGTYKFNGNENIGIAKSGIWKTGGIDGQFEFYDDNGNLIEYASQFGGNGNEKIIFNLYDSNEIRFIKKRINKNKSQ
ncbi:hypothetical protein [Tenacibaculum sp. 190524A02b]|uniref:hypothetical protein n=1 Tax=Tenacibaculum vairaonense TaxID=3137860 RepID=UPI0032B28A42